MTLSPDPIVFPVLLLQTASSELFQVAAQGDTTGVVSILRGGAVFPDVVDSDGHSSLFVAAVSLIAVPGIDEELTLSLSLSLFLS